MTPMEINPLAVSVLCLLAIPVVAAAGSLLVRGLEAFAEWRTYRGAMRFVREMQKGKDSR